MEVVVVLRAVGGCGCGFLGSPLVVVVDEGFAVSLSPVTNSKVES